MESNRKGISCIMEEEEEEEEDICVSERRIESEGGRPIDWQVISRTEQATQTQTQTQTPLTPKR